mmetsp:Transcript_43209/g.50592  ORF Transcript_43209/g.50592 Transcript_43209/m.50592 type:complete len:85 (-) Transcript_43209:2-256(-)
MNGYEQTMQANYLSHFLIFNRLVEAVSAAPDPCIVLVGSVTEDDNTVGGGGVYPVANLHELAGFKAGFENLVAIADGYNSKLCL